MSNNPSATFSLRAWTSNRRRSDATSESITSTSSSIPSIPDNKAQAQTELQKRQNELQKPIKLDLKQNIPTQLILDFPNLQFTPYDGALDSEPTNVLSLVHNAAKKQFADLLTIIFPALSHPPTLPPPPPPPTTPQLQSHSHLHQQQQHSQYHQHVHDTQYQQQTHEQHHQFTQNHHQSTTTSYQHASQQQQQQQQQHSNVHSHHNNLPNPSPLTPEDKGKLLSYWWQNHARFLFFVSEVDDDIAQVVASAVSDVRIARSQKSLSDRYSFAMEFAFRAVDKALLEYREYIQQHHYPHPQLSEHLKTKFISATKFMLDAMTASANLVSQVAKCCDISLHRLEQKVVDKICSMIISKQLRDKERQQKAIMLLLFILVDWIPDETIKQKWLAKYASRKIVIDFYDKCQVEFRQQLELFTYHF